MDKLITFAIPCYNSAAYMDTCIQSIMDACVDHDDYEIVIVDDGSRLDATPQKADEWHERFPEIIQVVHQENGGHGAAVLAGLAAAHGRYFKVVDSDDWIDLSSARLLLADMRRLEEAGEVVDLFIANYVYEHVEDNTQKVIRYRHVLPEGRVFEWDEMRPTRPDQNLLMHSLLYRTCVLREGGLPLPHHTYYVDNIFAYVPLPRCKKIFYRDTNFYRYYIGRQDQSVNEAVMVGRYRQQLRITRIMFEALHLYDEVESKQLRRYMLQYFCMMMTISSIFSLMSTEPESDALVARLWSDLKTFDERMYRHARYGVLGIMSNLPGALGKRITIGAYRLARKIFKFN